MICFKINSFPVFSQHIGHFLSSKDFMILGFLRFDKFSFPLNEEPLGVYIWKCMHVLFFEEK